MTEKKQPAQHPSPGIDWAAIRHRMESSFAALSHGGAPSAAAQARVLKARAAALAREPRRQDLPEQLMEVIEFRLAHENYAVDSSLVREVYPLREITPLPATPAFVLGIINVRGQIVSVVDLKKFFDLPERGITDLNKVIILSDAHMEFGLLVDAVIGVQRLPLPQIQPPPPTLTGIRQEYLIGVTENRMVILDAARILGDPNIVVRDEAQA